MNVTREASGDLTAIVHIQLKEEDYIEAVNKQLNDYRRKAAMPGFRPGKVPMGLIRKMYGNSVQAEEINKKVSEVLNQYITDEKLDLLGYPLPNMEKTKMMDFSSQKEFDFYFDIALSPEFELKLDKNLKIPYYRIKVTDEDVDNAIKDVKVRFGEEEFPEKAELGDGLQGKFVRLDAEGNEVETDHQHTSFFRIEDIKLKTIQKKFVGKGAGDAVVFNPFQAFKDEAKTKSVLHMHSDDEEEMKADYRFEIEKVVRVTEAELGEDLYKKVYPNDEIKTEEEFREKVTADLEQHFSRDTDRQFVSDAINALIEKSGLELPDDFMKRWLLESNQGKITAEQIEEQYDSYSKTMRWQLIEARLQKEYGDAVSVSNDEIRNKVKEYFTAMGSNIDDAQINGIIDTVLQNPDERQRIYNDLLDEKLIGFFKEHLGMKEKKVTQKEFFEIASNTK